MHRRLLLLIIALLGALAPAGARASAPAYRAGQVVVELKAHAASTRRANTKLVHLPEGETVRQGIRRLRRDPNVASAVPNYVAHVTGLPTKSYDPNDPGKGHGWAEVQWNFLARAGVNAPLAWANARAAGHPGGRGVRIAVLDTGAAYRTVGAYRRSPDFNGTRFVRGYDFVHGDATPLDIRTCTTTDRQGHKHVIDGAWGHGTHITGTIAETTNNHVGVTGLAYGASILEVRVLDSCGYGDASTIAKGIRYAVRRGAQIINLSVEFDPGTLPSDIPEVLRAMHYARVHNVLVVAAAGNDGERSIAYPARSPDAFSVGASTDDRCLADYSNYGPGLDIVAPGGGDDSDLTHESSCNLDHVGRSIYQETYTSTSPGRFGLARDYEGTSMACPHVTATAALIIASRVIGAHPSVAALRRRLELTAHDRGPKGYDSYYGWGIVDAGSATSSG